MNIKWRNLKELQYIYMNENTLRLLDREANTQIQLHFGTLIVIKEIKINNELDNNTIEISPNLTKKFTLPEEIPCQVILKDNRLHIGPYIGMLITKRGYKLTPKKLELLKERIPNRENSSGIIIVGSHDEIDFAQKQMKGFYFSKSRGWQEGLFPLPTVMYNRPYMKKELYNQLSKDEDIYLFNNCLMTKQKLWDLLSDVPEIKKYLPHTKSLTNVESFLTMTKSFPVVYLKPSNLSRGRGIIRAEKTKSGYKIKNSKNQENFIRSREELAGYITSLTQKNNYLVQQAVPFKYGNRMVDFRLYMQKDETMDWNCSGIYGRVSKRGHIVTNLKHSKAILMPEDVFRKYFKLNQKDRAVIQQSMVGISKAVCKQLENLGQIIGDVAIDMVVDENKDIWILEVQVNYAADKRLYHLPAAIHKKVWQTPILYAQALTGFL